ncbi:hypothetical protein GLYMA_01G231066v4 [Glycine max]|nr:hypothetical protein GLYMA_01G231066v4 [Glycine max]KAH1164322.1 hypothetical protein GYH30_002390 [Glycine max]
MGHATFTTVPFFFFALLNLCDVTPTTRIYLNVAIN